MNTDRYLFGDTDLAATRLGVLAEVFASTSRTFLSSAAYSRCNLAVDMGCGPGHTTQMIVRTLKPARVIGLDMSERFIRLARRNACTSVSFSLHDMTAGPTPTDQCDLMYGRFLLAHLEGTEGLVAAWSTQLAPRGRMLLEEVDDIITTQPTFRRYLDIVEAMLARAGSDLYVGRRLGAMDAPAWTARCFNRSTQLAVSNQAAARMFAMNIQTWRTNQFVRDNYDDGEIDRLTSTLMELADTPTDNSDIKWRLRQVAFERER